MLMRWCTDWPSLIRSHGLIIITNIIIMLCPLRDKYLCNAHLSHKSYLNKYRHCPAKDQIPLWTNDSFRRDNNLGSSLNTQSDQEEVDKLVWEEAEDRVSQRYNNIKDLPVTLYLCKVPCVGVHGLPREHERALRATWTGADSTYDDDGVLGPATPNGLVYKQSHDTNDSVAAVRLIHCSRSS